MADAKSDENAACQSNTALRRFHADLVPKEADLVLMIDQSGGWQEVSRADMVADIATAGS